MNPTAVKLRYVTVPGFGRLLGILVALLGAEPKDILGQLYMSLELGNTNTGQFFTPPEVSELMAGSPRFQCNK